MKRPLLLSLATAVFVIGQTQGTFVKSKLDQAREEVKRSWAAVQQVRPERLRPGMDPARALEEIERSRAAYDRFLMAKRDYHTLLHNRYIRMSNRLSRSTGQIEVSHVDIPGLAAERAGVQAQLAQVAQQGHTLAVAEAATLRAQVNQLTELEQEGRRLQQTTGAAKESVAEAEKRRMQAAIECERFAHWLRKSAASAEADRAEWKRYHETLAQRFKRPEPVVHGGK